MSLPERLDPNIWGEQEAQSREVRGEEADIGQRQASAASSAASAERSRATTPVDIERTRSQTATEEATRPAAVRRVEAEATTAEIRAAEAREAYERSRGLRPPTDKARQDTVNLLRDELRDLVGAVDLIENRMLATGFGSETLAGIGGTSASELDSKLKPIRANNALTAIQTYMAAGGTPLTPMSDSDIALLQSSAGDYSLTRNDAELTEQILRGAKGRVVSLMRLGADPYEIADILGPKHVYNFAEDLTSWRALPSDEEAIVGYVNDTRADGTFNPADYASLMGQAYERATGRQPDEGFFDNAVNSAYELQGSESAISGLSYDASDAAVRDTAVRRVQAEGPDSTSVSDMYSGAAANMLPSTLQLGVDTLRAFTVDAPQTLMGFATIAAELTGLADDTDTIDAIGEYYSDRYGSAEGLRRAIALDPASVVADVVGVLSLGSGAAATGANVARRAAVTEARAAPVASASRAEALSRAATAARAARSSQNFTSMLSRFDPFVKATQLGAMGLGLAKTVARGSLVNAPASLANVAPGTVDLAFDAGRRGSPEFTSALRGEVPAQNPVDQARTAVQEMYGQRSLDYQDARNRLNLNERVPFTEIDRALLDTETMGRFRDVPPTRRAPEAWTAANDIVENFRIRGYDDIESADAMKQQLGELRDSYPRGTPEHRVVSDIYNGVREAITKAAPEYAKMMEDYTAASDALSDIRATLATGAASPDTTLRRLQQQVGGRGPRGRTVLDLLENTNSGRGLTDTLAGMALSGTDVSRTASLGGTGAGIGGFVTGTPEMAALTALAAGSTPRRLGNVAYGTGRLAGGIEDAFTNMAARPVVNGRSISDLAQAYGVPALNRGRAALPVVNPAIIQPLVDPSLPQEEQTVLPPAAPPYTDVLPVATLAPSGASLEELSQQYGPLQNGSGAESLSLEQLSQRYEGVPTVAPEGAPAGTATQPGTVREIGGIPAVFDPSAGGWVNADTGELVEEAAFKRGGRVKMKNGGPVHMPKMVFAPRRPVPTRALRG